MCLVTGPSAMCVLQQVWERELKHFAGAGTGNVLNYAN